MNPSGLTLVRYRSAAALCWFVCTFAGCGDYVSSDRLLAVLVEADAGARLRTSRAGATSEPFVPGAQIHQGDSIETDADSTATVSLLPGVFLRVNRGSFATVEALKLIKSGDDMNYSVGSRQARVRLNSGSICATTPDLITHVDLQIITAAGVLIVPALTSCCVMSEGEVVHAAVTEGQLTFSGDDDSAEPVVIQAGEYADLRKTGGSAASSVRRAAEGPVTWQHLADEIALEQSANRSSILRRGGAPVEAK
jgi:hypothetical protein